VAREIINHRSLRHPNIIRFKEVRAKRRADFPDGECFLHTSPAAAAGGGEFFLSLLNFSFVSSFRAPVFLSL